MSDWIEHRGGQCPVPEETLVDVKFRDGGTGNGFRAEWWTGFGPTHNHWRSYGKAIDIVAYRIVKET